MANHTFKQITGYSPFHGSGWYAYGRLIINYHNHRVISVFFNGEQVF